MISQLITVYRYIKDLDLYFRRRGRHVAYTLDNFSGHKITYKPTNMTLIFFMPNLTPFCQPCDAGIIRCFKAHYWRAFCMRAIDLDEAGEADIFAINQLEVMKMAREAWDAVSADTVRNCWNHTGIQHQPLSAVASRSSTDAPTAAPTSQTTRAQEILRAWAADVHMGLPMVKAQLRELLGGDFVEEALDGVFDTVLAAEDNTDAALTALDHHPLPLLPDSASDRSAKPPGSTADDGPSTVAGNAAPVSHVQHISEQGRQLEADLLDKVAELRRRNRIHGEPLTIDELVAPPGEDEVGEDDAVGEGGDDKIVARVEEEEASKNGQHMEVDGSNDEDKQVGDRASNREMQDMCRMLEMASICSPASPGTELARLLRQFRAELVREELRSARQTTMDAFVTRCGASASDNVTTVT
jgi:hypothetical protein